MLTIDKNKCNKCGVCIKTCPINLIAFGSEGYPSMEDASMKRCVNCGHCEAVCQNDALQHEYPQTYTEPKENGRVELEAEEVSLYFRNRRSIRNYKQKAVEKEIIENVLDVVRYAPTGKNSQTVKWLIVYDTTIVNHLAEMTIDFMRIVMQNNKEMALNLGFFGYVKMVETGVATPSQIICRNSPHLAISYIEFGNIMGINDTIIASSHFELILPAYSLGCCWAGYLMMAFQTMKEMKVLIGLDEYYVVKSALMFGYPQYKYQKVPARKAIDVKWI